MLNYNLYMKKIFIGIFVFAFLFIIQGINNESQAASPPPTYYSCKNDQCVEDPKGKILAECTEICYTESNDPLCNDGESINTAIGCVPIGDTDTTIGWILGWAIGVGGGIAFLLIIYASFMTMTSQGNPERLKAGQELLTSAISGLVLLIFSVFILKFIGIDILGLDNFGFGK